MEPVLGLLESETSWTVENLVCDFLTAMGGQAMHRDGVGCGQIEQLAVYLVVTEGRQPRMSLFFLAHRDPDVGVYGIGAPNECAGIVPNYDPAERAAMRSGAIAVGMGEPDFHAKDGARKGKGGKDVVPVADEGQNEPIEMTEMFSERQQIGQSLARMLVVGEGVDNRDAGLGREFRDDRVIERAGHNGVDPALEVVGDVGDALPNAQADPFREIQRMSAELVDAGFERDPRPQALLLENQGNRTIGQELVRMTPTSPKLLLEGDRPLEHNLIFVATEIGRADEIPTAQPVPVGPLAALSLRETSCFHSSPQKTEPPGPNGSGGSIQ